MQNDLPVIEALISAFLLLEHSGPDEVNPDTAVRAMENMAWNLLNLSEDDQRLLRVKLEKIAAEAEDSGYREFVRGLPDMIGLASLE